MSNRFPAVLVVVVVVVVAVACDGAGRANSDAVTAAEAPSLCERMCERGLRCNGTDPSFCVADCVEQVTGLFRYDALEAVAECVRELPCGTNEDRCLTRVQPLPVHREWESVCTGQLAMCNEQERMRVCPRERVEEDPTPDFDDVAFWFVAPAIMEQLIDCIDGAGCAEWFDCVGAVLAPFRG